MKSNESGNLEKNETEQPLNHTGQWHGHAPISVSVFLFEETVLLPQLLGEVQDYSIVSLFVLISARKQVLTQPRAGILHLSAK